MKTNYQHFKLSTMVNNENEEWLPIVGFPNYQVNRTKVQMRSFARGKEKILKLTETNHATVIRNGEDKLCISWKKACYCALNNINPLDMSDAKLCVFMRGGRFVVLTQHERMVEMSSINARKEPMTLDAIKQRYEEGMAFMRNVIDMLETGESKWVTEYLYSLKDSVCAYLCRSMNVNSPETRMELFCESVHILMRVIKNRDKAVLNPLSYLYHIARGLVISMRRENKMFREYVEK